MKANHCFFNNKQLNRQSQTKKQCHPWPVSRKNQEGKKCGIKNKSAYRFQTQQKLM